MSDFRSSWVRKNEEGGLDRVGRALRSEEPLKPKLEKALRKIRMQNRKLDSILRRLSEKDAKLFRKIVNSQKQQRETRVAIIANELVELRKLERKIEQSKLALEQIALRIETAAQMGDIASILTPAAGVIRSVGSGLGGVMPEGNRAMNDISAMLNDILLDAGMAGGQSLNFQAANMEAEKILEEASTVVEQRMRRHLPEIPADIPVRNQDGGVLAT